MRSFKDTTGKLHDVNVTVATIARVKSQTGVNFMEIIGEKSREIIEKLSDPETFVSVLGAVLNCDGLALAESLDGDSVEAAMNAILESVLDFFPKEKSHGIRLALQKTRQAMDRMQREANASLQAMIDSGELDAKIESALNPSFGSLPENSALTQTH